MNEIKEYIISGFCRNCNQGQTVTCEVIQQHGKIELESVDCGFLRCLHTSSCQIAQQIQNILNKKSNIHEP